MYTGHELGIIAWLNQQDVQNFDRHSGLRRNDNEATDTRRYSAFIEWASSCELLLKRREA